MKKNTIILIALWGVTLLSVIVNFNDCLMGSPASTVGTIVSALYVIAWTVFTIYNRKQGISVMAIIWGGLTLIIASISCYIAAFNLIGAAIIPFVLLLLTPFYGFEIFASDMVMYAVAIVSSLAWVLISIVTLRASRAKSQKE